MFSFVVVVCERFYQIRMYVLLVCFAIFVINLYLIFGTAVSRSKLALIMIGLKLNY